MAAVFIFAAAWATSAAAEFTAAEKASLTSLGQAQIELLIGDNAVQGAVKAAKLPATHVAVAKLSARTGGASFRVHETLGALMNVRVTGTTPPPTWNRSNWIEVARNRHALAVEQFEKAEKELAVALALERDNGEYQHTLEVAQRRLTRATKHFDKVEMALPYADPWPSVESTRTTAQVLDAAGLLKTVGVELIGPHGSYAQTVDRCWWSGRYMDHYRDALTNMYARGPWVSVGGGRAVPAKAIAAAIVDANAITSGLTRTLLLLHGIVLSPDDVRASQFLTVLRASQITSEFNPAKFLATSFVLLELIAIDTPHVKDAKDAARRLMDAWKHNDECFWAMMLFPAGAR